MSNKTRRMTLSALFAALTVVVLYISSVFPTGQLGIVAFASFFSAAAVIECGLVPGVSVFVISSLLGAVIMPLKGAVLLYIIFLGYYPVAKCIIERLNRVYIQWFFKLILFNAAFTAVYFFFKPLFYSFLTEGLNAILLAGLGNTVFVLYDLGFTRLINVYVNTISKKLKRK